MIHLSELFDLFLDEVSEWSRKKEDFFLKGSALCVYYISNLQRKKKHRIWMWVKAVTCMYCKYKCMRGWPPFFVSLWPPSRDSSPFVLYPQKEGSKLCYATLCYATWGCCWKAESAFLRLVWEMYRKHGVPAKKTFCSLLSKQLRPVKREQLPRDRP